MKYIFFKIISSSLFRNKRFVLNDMFQWNTTKFWNVSLEYFRECNYSWKVCYDLQKSWTFSIKKDVHRISYMVINKTYEIAQSILLSIKGRRKWESSCCFWFLFFRYHERLVEYLEHFISSLKGWMVREDKKTFKIIWYFWWR